MTFRERGPDLLSPHTIDSPVKRCWSTGDVHDRHIAANKNSSNTIPNLSFDNSNSIRAHIHRQESCPSESDIGLEDHKAKQPAIQCLRYPNRRSSSLPLPCYDTYDELYRTAGEEQFPDDSLIKVSYSNDSLQSNNVPTDDQIVPTYDQNVPTDDQPSQSERPQNRLQRRAAELIERHFPEAAGEIEVDETANEQLCHDIVKELKNIADTYDSGHADKNPIQLLQETLNINVTGLLPPCWLRHRIGSAIAKTTLDLALRYYRM